MPILRSQHPWGLPAKAALRPVSLGDHRNQ